MEEYMYIRTVCVGGVYGVHGLGCSAMPRPCCTATVQAQLMAGTPAKIHLISWGTMSPISDIKLIRTDTTLDLSQKAEKGMPNYQIFWGLFGSRHFRAAGCGYGLKSWQSLPCAEDTPGKASSYLLGIVHSNVTTFYHLLSCVPPRLEFYKPGCSFLHRHPDCRVRKLDRHAEVK